MEDKWDPIIIGAQMEKRYGWLPTRRGYRGNGTERETAIEDEWEFIETRNEDRIRRMWAKNS